MQNQIISTDIRQKFFAKGGQNVSKEKKEKFKNRLRWLVASPLGEDEFLRLQFSKSLTKDLNESIIFILQFYQIHQDENHLWARLINKGYSFRHSSQELNKILLNYLEKILKLEKGEISSLKIALNSKQKYLLAFYEYLDENELSSFYLDMVKAREGKRIIPKIEYTDSENLMLESFLINDENLESFEKKISKITDSIPYIHVQNRINLFYLKNNQFEKLEKGICLSLKKLEGIKSKDLKKQIQGILSYHQSVLFREMQRMDKVVNCLKFSIKNDPSYFDYYYQLAQIFHDDGNESCREFYIASLKRSGFEESILNDYGCYLSESTINKSREIIEIEQLFKVLYG